MEPKIAYYRYKRIIVQNDVYSHHSAVPNEQNLKVCHIRLVFLKFELTKLTLKITTLWFV